MPRDEVSGLRLVGDGIEDPPNARALLDAAAMFGIGCLFRDTRDLSERWRNDLGGGPLPTVDTRTLLEEMRPILALENAAGSRSVFEAPPLAGHPSLVVGNERRGVRGDLMRAADAVLHIPLARRGPNTLNVAAAAAVALYNLRRRARRGLRRTARPDSRRPGLLILAPSDHVEAGSALRSAAAFGWGTVCVSDRRSVWFGTPRPIRAEGRAAARSHRSMLRIVQIRDEDRSGFREAIVVGAHVDGPPLGASRLAAGPVAQIVLPDESEGAFRSEDWARFGDRVRFARIDLPAASFGYRFRLTASIALAEVSRQVGFRPRDLGERRPTTRLTYESALRSEAIEATEILSAEQLEAY
jgi:tRNA G18 (ribose-2'-O)-methylase SpoU